MYSTILIFVVQLPIMKLMEGVTIEDMADKLKLPYKTVAQRLLRGKYEPIFSGNLYTIEVFEAIRNVPGKGRPKKAVELEPARPKTKKPAKGKK